MQQKKGNLYIPKSLRLLFSGVFIFNLLWWMIAVVFHNKALPNPISVYELFPSSWVNGMNVHALASFKRIIAGTFFSLILALAGGLLTGMNQRANRLLSPLLYLSYPVPKLALLPVVMILFGIGETTKIVMIVLIIVFQLMISIRDAIKSIDKQHFLVLSSLGASVTQHIRHIILPGILPDILSALRVTVGIATSVLFVTETFGTDKGLGFFIVDAWMRLDYLTMYSGIVMLAIIGFMLFLFIDLVDWIFCRWNKIKSGL